MTNPIMFQAIYIIRSGEVVELTDYRVTTDGTVYRVYADKIIEVPQNVDHGDYLLVNIKNKRLGTSSGYRSLYVHRIVLSTFGYSDYRKGYDCDHIDGNRQNNNIGNLTWMTQKENNRKARCIPITCIYKPKNITIPCDSLNEARELTRYTYTYIKSHINISDPDRDWAFITI